MNKAQAVSDDEDDEGFPIGEVYNTETQLDAEEDVEVKEVNKNNDFLKTIMRATAMETTHHMYNIIP